MYVQNIDKWRLSLEDWVWEWGNNPRKCLPVNTWWLSCELCWVPTVLETKSWGFRVTAEKYNQMSFAVWELWYVHSLYNEILLWASVLEFTEQTRTSVCYTQQWYRLQQIMWKYQLIVSQPLPETGSWLTSVIVITWNFCVALLHMKGRWISSCGPCSLCPV